MKKRLIRLIQIAAILYISIGILLYVFQEKLIFFPEKLGKDYVFEFQQANQEYSFKTPDGKLLNGVLFRADSSKGLIFYLHGNAGSLKGWGDLAFVYTSMHYDVFMLDYRGFGKSEGNISSEQQLFDDVQLVYDSLKTQYSENRIMILGYSIGTGPASWLASKNKARLLVLQAPYFSLKAMMQQDYPIIPTFILKYPIRTDQYLKDCKMPIVIFHGTDDGVIPYAHSQKLKPLLKSSDTLITLQRQDHNGMTENVQYRESFKKIIDRR